jgi:hypothetical protein
LGSDLKKKRKKRSKIGDFFGFLWVVVAFYLLLWGRFVFISVELFSDFHFVGLLALG